MRRLWMCAALGLAALVASPSGARGDVIELVGGRVVQGTVVAGQSTEEGLGLQLFDTGGTILVKWDHIIPARRKQLRQELGIEVSLEDEILVPGHRVLFSTGKVMEGLALNPDQKGDPLQIKTRTGVASVDRSTVTRIDEISLPGLEIYTSGELYDRIRDQDPPDSPAKHLELAQKCMRIGALDQAKQHLDAAAADGKFPETTEGRKIPTLQRQLDLLLRSKGAQDLVVQIETECRNRRWNEALAHLDQLDEQHKDEQVRKLIRFDLLSSKVVRGRAAYFRKTVQSKVYSAMDKLIGEKAREKKPDRLDTEPKRGGATPGTLAAARQWMARDLVKQIWERVGAELDLSKQEELDQFWTDRTGKGRYASYGRGSFVVEKKTAPKTAGQNPDRQRRPPGSQREPQGGSGGPQRETKEDRPKTEEEWWDEATTPERTRFLIALFAETGGLLETVRVDRSELCEGCGGRGVNVTNNADGSVSSTVCPRCNSAQLVRKVFYR